MKLSIVKEKYFDHLNLTFPDFTIFRMMIKRAVNASDDDVVIFTGSGTTGAIHKLIGVLELKEGGENTVRQFLITKLHNN